MTRLALLSGLALSLASHPALAQQSVHDSVVGAVQALDTNARTLEVTTGVGMALRSVRLAVPPTIPVKSSGTTVALEQLHAGDIVKVTYGGPIGAFIAYSIERLGRMDAGRAP